MRFGAQVVGSTHQAAGRLSAGLGRGPLREPLGDVRRVAQQYAAGRGMAPVLSPARLVRLQQVVRAARLNRASVTCGAEHGGATRCGAEGRWWTSAHQSTELSGGLGGARRPLGGVRREAERCDSGRSGAQAWGLHLTDAQAITPLASALPSRHASTTAAGAALPALMPQ